MLSWFIWRFWLRNRLHLLFLLILGAKYEHRFTFVQFQLAFIFVNRVDGMVSVLHFPSALFISVSLFEVVVNATALHQFVFWKEDVNYSYSDHYKWLNAEGLPYLVLEEELTYWFDDKSDLHDREHVFSDARTNITINGTFPQQCIFVNQIIKDQTSAWQQSPNRYQLSI